MQLLSFFPSDPKALYVIFTWESGAQIYELVAQTVGERKKWVFEPYKATYMERLHEWLTSRLYEILLLINWDPKHIIWSDTQSLFNAPVGRRRSKIRLKSWKRRLGNRWKEIEVAARPAAPSDLHITRECVCCFCCCWMGFFFGKWQGPIKEYKHPFRMAFHH